MQTFPWLGKLQRRGDMALEASEAAREKYEAEKLRLFYRVKHAYYEYYYLSRAIAVTEENIDLMSNLEAVVRTRLQTGGAPYSAVVKAQVELGKLEERLATLVDMRGPMAARLNTELGRPPDTYVPWPAAIDSENATFSDEDIFDRLKAGNPELLALGFMAARDEAAVGLSRQSYVPDITLGAQVIQTGPALNPDMEDSGKDAVMATLSLNLPIWIGKYRAEEKEARARLRATAKQRENRENQLMSELKMVLFNLRSAERKIDLYGDSLVPKAEQSLSATRTAYSADKADFFDLIEAQRTLLEFLLSYERALADRAQRLAEIEMMIGREIDRENRGAQEEGTTDPPAADHGPVSPAD
jgi:cobalt-zinc-cadmium efflux system outer membrane protein